MYIIFLGDILEYIFACNMLLLYSNNVSSIHVDLVVRPPPLCAGKLVTAKDLRRLTLQLAQEGRRSLSIIIIISILIIMIRDALL